MKKAFKRIAAGLTVAATVSSMLLTVAPAHAAAPTSMKDTLSREAVSTVSTHNFTATMPSFSNGNIVTFAYGDAGFTGLFGGTPSCTLGTGTCTAAVSATNVRITCTNAGGCSGALTIGTFSGINPSSPGSAAVSISGNGDPVSGQFAIPIVDSDQVTVTATVSASITFDIDTYATSAIETETAAPYSVALGTLDTASVKGSNESTINAIWLDLDTNAAGGAIVTVSSTNSSLKSTSTPADTIPSANGAMSAGTANYGICVKDADASAAIGQPLVAVAPFASTCTTTPSSNTVGGLTGATQTILNQTVPGAIADGRAEIMVDAAISNATAAHNDYTDTLKFIATGTF